MRRALRTRALIAFLAAMALVGTLGTSAGAQPAFMEDFEDGDVAGWILSDPTNNGSIEAVTTPVSPNGGNYVGKVTFGGSCYGAKYPLDRVAPDYFSWYFRADGDTSHPSGLAFRLASKLGSLAVISYHQGFLRYHIDGWDYGQIMPASMGTWYLIELRNFDWGSSTFDIWVDGVKKVVGAPFRDDLDYVEVLSNFACPPTTGPSYVDDITFGFDDEGPAVTHVGASPNPAAVAQSLTLSATLDDSQTGNSMIAAAEYAIDGGPYSPMSASDGAFDEPTEAVEATLGSFDTPAVHTLCVRGTDAAGNTSSEVCTFLAVYDPEGGFVTGGGWIDSPEGAYKDDPDLTGQATFGFVSKYDKGAEVPTGNTEFQFHAADLKFHSDTYQWLVVTGGDYAIFKGEGTINDEGDYKFQIWAADDDADTFRIKIWEEDEFDVETVIYDNGFDQELGSGLIIIHTNGR